MNIIQIENDMVELVAEPGQYITQAAEVWDGRVFCTRRVLLPGETAADWRDATAQEKSEYEAFTPPPQRPCRTALTSLFEAAGATFNDETGYYEMNGLADLTEEDIHQAYRLRHVTADGGAVKLDTFSAGNAGNHIRTNFPFSTFFRTCTELTIYGQVSLEVLNTGTVVKGNEQPFHLQKIECYACRKLRKILGVLDFANATKEITGGYITDDALQLLEEAQCRNVKVSFSMFRNSAVITLASLAYLVDNASNTSAITITVHPDVYAKLTDPSNTEWYAVNTAAQAKQIAFATTEAAQVAMLAMRTLPEAQILDGELLAPAGCYLTQAEETPIEERLFITRKVILPGEDVSKWRVATTEEKREQDEYFEQQLPS